MGKFYIAGSEDVGMATGAGGETVSEIKVTRSDGKYVARHVESSVVSQGDTQAEALANLAEALALHYREVPEDAEEPEPSDAPWL